ncbi:hypothetical protein [Candidatus Nitrotoga sp. AM1P]|uniref:hypothetical protein n=1 Tax=Candidatus Nitrotoga sp. AM1P TaxID=2559597 RepID=UPI0010B25A2E|nr:hypothetical protein [Candidatus Nitrotoga sp. AM1P]BBJ24079.1 hypothetical protein W01_20060 [Candidatus Nitrotoga sp. AM1P]
MTAFFGIDEHNSEKFFKQGVVCIDNSIEKEAVLFKTFQSIRTEDIVFIKSFTQAGLKVKAIGVVLSGFPTENELGVCIPVEWIWKDEKFIEQFGEELAHCSDTLYEEYNTLVQREIIDLLPARFQLTKEW